MALRKYPFHGIILQKHSFIARFFRGGNGADKKPVFNRRYNKKGETKMKKILALLMALIMALGCVGAFAEETQSNEITFEIPAFTVAFESTVNTEALAALLPMFGVDEATVGMAQAILPLLAEMNGQLVFADNGAQFDLGLKGQNVLTIAGEKNEGTIAVASDILPSFVLTLSTETIKQLFEQFTAQSQEALAGVDMEALIANMTGYAMQFAGVCSQAVTFGDPEMGEFVFEDLEKTFNCRMPINIDMEAIKAGLETLIQQIKSDETIGSLISTMGTMGMPVDMSEDPEIVVPQEVTAYTYANVDEEGNQVDDTTLVTVETVTTVEEVTVTVDVTVLVEGSSVSVAVEMPEQDIAITVYVEPADDGVGISFYFEGMGVTAGEVLAISMGETLQLYSETYLMDMENPICTELVTFAQGGERTFTVLDENKTVFSVEQLMSDTTGEAVQALLADVMNNGLGNLIAKVSQIMPEQMGTLMNLFMPAEAVEGAAE